MANRSTTYSTVPFMALTFIDALLVLFLISIVTLYWQPLGLILLNIAYL
jgi:hypothetical protein